jgi:cyclopropane-fatty-acyl-phospholipid synthase
MLVELLTRGGVTAIESGLVPDWVTRAGIRRLCRQRLQNLSRGNTELRDFIEDARGLPIAVSVDKANDQHYEVPAEFFSIVLGSHWKYSCCYWAEGVSNLSDAEAAALEMTCERLRLVDGHRVLELGCGWGSLALWMAERFPNSQITTVSGSKSQRQFIESVARSKALANLEVVTCDMNQFNPNETFDRVVSVEMFEHMSNPEALIRKIANWLNPGGELLIHVFCHKKFAYRFESRGAADWMSQHFFTGGIMPAKLLFPSMDHPFRLDTIWEWNGSHYRQTADAWLENLDRNQNAVIEIFQQVYGRNARKWLNRWRVFFMAVSELFGFADGNEWLVCHYRFINGGN